MAESMKGLRRTCRCAEVTEDMIGSTVTLMGWTQKRRNLGSLIFVDLRDRSGLMQVLFDETSVGSDGFEKAGTIRNEYVLAVTGIIQKRGGAVNEKLKTGTMELMATELRILSESETPPFYIEEDRREQSDEGRTAPEEPYAGSAPSGYPEEPDGQEPRGTAVKGIHGKGRLPGDRDSDAREEHAGRST